MVAPRTHVFRPLVKGNEALGTRLGSFANKQKLKIAGFFASLPFLAYFCNNRLNPSIHCVQLEKNNTVSAGVE